MRRKLQDGSMNHVMDGGECLDLHNLQHHQKVGQNRIEVITLLLQHLEQRQRLA